MYKPKSRRWYDQDPTMSEAMELLRLSTDDLKGQAADYISKMQEQVAHEVIEKVYEAVKKYSYEGNRWYDKDPVVLKAIELLRAAPPRIQKKAAKKLLSALQECDEIDDFGKIFE
ncbi:MAG: hypothetical protein AB1782_04330 [Cyanobacteriota bacterium]